MQFIRNIIVLSILGGVVAGCSVADRLSQVGQVPKMTNVQNPVQHPSYRPVSLPMPVQGPTDRHPNSLWRTGARQFFKDQRAGDVGDILTVTIAIDDSATINNKTTRTRSNEEGAEAPSLLGYEASLNKLLPNAVNPASLIDLESSSKSEGNGVINRDESINLKVAAVITQRLPNGNLVVHGRQEMRVNFEVRELQIAGIIRPEDIASDNTISYEKIAEARISYGGRGQITDVQQPRYGQQIYDILFPF